MEHVIQFLKESILIQHRADNITTDEVAVLLCGENKALAENPFSEEFLKNVAYNSDNSKNLILYLQLSYLQDMKNEA